MLSWWLVCMTWALPALDGSRIFPVQSSDSHYCWVCLLGNPFSLSLYLVLVMIYTLLTFILAFKTTTGTYILYADNVYGKQRLYVIALFLLCLTTFYASISTKTWWFLCNRVTIVLEIIKYPNSNEYIYNRCFLKQKNWAASYLSILKYQLLSVKFFDRCDYRYMLFKQAVFHVRYCTLISTYRYMYR